MSGAIASETVAGVDGGIDVAMVDKESALMKKRKARKRRG
jgi:hypothetical protein